MNPKSVAVTGPFWQTDRPKIAVSAGVTSCGRFHGKHRGKGKKRFRPVSGNSRGEADRHASPDVHKQFGDRCEDVRVRVTAPEMVLYSSGAEGCGLGGRPCIRVCEHMESFLVWDTAQWACIQVAVTAFEEL